MIVLNDLSTWPTDVISYMERNYEVFLKWETNHKEWSDSEAVEFAGIYDDVVYGLRDVLDAYKLHGYHCTRLQDCEIKTIQSNGMQLPSLRMLRERIRSAMKYGLFSPEVAKLLEEKNQADEEHRAGMIWFCVFSSRTSYIGEEWGLYDLFRFWGGEALYNSHDVNPITGPILQKIGSPCIIEVKVPIRALSPHGGLELKVANHFLFSRGFDTGKTLGHEDRAIQPIPPDNIIRVIRYQEPDFATLTGCDKWSRSIE